MRKVSNKIDEFFSCLFGIMMAILLGICFVVLLPLDYIKYKRSLFYKTEHRKYKLFAATGVYFELYNEIIKNKLPIKYFFNPNNDALECGWFVFDNTLIIPNVFSFEFDSESRIWNYCCEDDEEKRIIISLDEYIETEVQEVNELAGQIICNDAIVLIDGNCIENKDIAKNERRFLIYEENREDVLKDFCSNSLK